MPPVGIALERVSKRFAHRVKGQVYAVREVSLRVAPGELVTLLGPSGSGKTTTLRMIAGFEEPDAGSVELAGRDVSGLPPYDREVNTDRKSTRLNSSHIQKSRMPSSA